MATGDRRLLPAALACLAGLVLTASFALLLPAGLRADSSALGGFVALDQTRFGGVASTLVHLVDAGPYVLFAAGFALLALLRRQPRLALAVLVMMTAATFSAELIKKLLAESRFSVWFGVPGGVEVAGWPSGHATAAMAVVLAAVLVAPAALRPLVALVGTALAVVISYSLLVLAWHFPSDVVGGLLLAGFWMSLTLGVLAWAERRWPTRRAGAAAASDVRTAALACLTGVVVASAAFLGRGDLVAAYHASPTAFLAMAVLIPVLAAVLAAALTLTLSGSGRAPRAARPVR